MGFFAILQVIFITLKLCEVIAWSWWLVFIPFYAWLALFVLMLVLFCYARRQQQKVVTSFLTRFK